MVVYSLHQVRTYLKFVDQWLGCRAWYQKLVVGIQYLSQRPRLKFGKLSLKYRLSSVREMLNVMFACCLLVSILASIIWFILFDHLQCICIWSSNGALQMKHVLYLTSNNCNFIAHSLRPFYQVLLSTLLTYLLWESMVFYGARTLACAREYSKLKSTAKKHKTTLSCFESAIH